MIGFGRMKDYIPQVTPAGGRLEKAPASDGLYTGITVPTYFSTDIIVSSLGSLRIALRNRSRPERDPGSEEDSRKYSRIVVRCSYNGVPISKYSGSAFLLQHGAHDIRKSGPVL